MNVWIDEEQETPAPQSAMTDVVFKLNGKTLPVDHAAALAQAVLSEASWIADAPGTGIQPIHVAASQNGWERPKSGLDADTNEIQQLILSRRTRLSIRILRNHAQRLIDQLTGADLDIDGYPLKIQSGAAKPLTSTSTLYSRYTHFKDCEHSAQEEEKFIDCVIAACQKNGFQPSRILCGLPSVLVAGDRQITTRSVLIANIPAAESLSLQDSGMGEHRLLGCGILVPHKDIAAVN